jgi:zinc transport system substrate-binding protein
MMPKAFPIALLAALFGLAAVPAGASDVPNVVSVKPVHSLVAAVMDGVGTPKLIVEGAASPHTYNLKPTNAEDLQNADIVFWVGHDLEAFLDKPLMALANHAKVVSFLGMKGMETLPPRESGTFEHHDHGDHGAAQTVAEGEEIDAHIWLDPENAKTMVRGIASTLAETDPAHANQYAANADAEIEKLDTLEKQVAEKVSTVKSKPFIVFHDAYQYFEQRFGVNVAGSITVSPDTVPGAARISEIHKKVMELGATCVFAEPQFEPKLVRVVMEGTPARTGVLDPEAANLKEGPQLYFDLLTNIANSMQECLSKD